MISITTVVIMSLVLLVSPMLIVVWAIMTSAKRADEYMQTLYRSHE